MIGLGTRGARLRVNHGLRDCPPCPVYSGQHRAPVHAELGHADHLGEGQGNTPWLPMCPLHRRRGRALRRPLRGEGAGVQGREAWEPAPCAPAPLRARGFVATFPLDGRVVRVVSPEAGSGGARDQLRGGRCERGPAVSGGGSPVCLWGKGVSEVRRGRGSASSSTGDI